MKDKFQWNIADLILPCFAVALGVYYLTTIQGIPLMAQAYGGALSILTIIVSIVVFVIGIKKSAFKNISTPMRFVKDNWSSPTFKMYIKVAILVVFVEAYILLIPYIGYPLTSIIFMSSVMYFLRIRKVSSLIGISLFVTILGFILFIVILKARLPLDIVSAEIKDLLSKFITLQ